MWFINGTTVCDHDRLAFDFMDKISWHILMCVQFSNGIFPHFSHALLSILLEKCLKQNVRQNAKYPRHVCDSCFFFLHNSNHTEKSIIQLFLWLRLRFFIYLKLENCIPMWCTTLPIMNIFSFQLLSFPLDSAKKNRIFFNDRCPSNYSIKRDKWCNYTIKFCKIIFLFPEISLWKK